MTLPDSLAGWAPYLDLFPKEVGASLAPMLRRLSAGIGPLQSDHSHGAGEPDGYNGLHRAGSYERLLLSEWLLAEEAPDEFLRRAAMGEHAFLRLARKEPSRARMSLALFDAGPEQLGAPRIAQLAALLVLARRAEAAGADFYWGILQDPHDEEQYTRGVDAAGVWRFLQARTAREASPWSIGYWLRTIEPEDTKDVWLIGGPRLARLPAADELSRLEISDPYEDLEERLDVAIRSPGRAPRLLTLPLPDAGECARLLRDPFGAVVREAIRTTESDLSPTSNLVFAAGGGRLMARCKGGVVTYHVPNSARAGVGKPHVVPVPEGWTCVAVGRMRKTLLFALLDESGKRLRLQRIGGKTERMLRREFELATPLRWDDTDGPLGEIAPDPESSESSPALFVRIGTTLIRVSPYAHDYEPSACSAVMRGEGVRALAPETHNVRYLLHDTQGAMLYSVVDHQMDWERLGPFRPDPAMFLGWRLDRAEPSGRWVAAVAGARREWRIVGSRQLDRTILAPEGAEVVGVMGEPRDAHEPGLVLLEGDRRLLSVIGPGWSQQLPPAAADIRHVTVSTAGPMIAYSTEAGDVVVWRCDRREVVFKLQGAPTTPAPDESGEAAT